MTESSTTTIEAGIVAPAWWSFPSPALLDAAVSVFPPSEYRNTVGGWSADPGHAWADRAFPAPLGSPRVRVPGVERGFMRREGGFPALLAGPGVVKYSVTDTNRAERSAERRRPGFSAQAVKRARMSSHLRPVPGESDPGELQAFFDRFAADYPDAAPLGTTRDVISQWSRKSQNQLRLKIGSLDLGEFLDSGTPVFATLTLPGPWETITPTAAHAARLFRRWERKFVKRFGRLRCIWKREFQRRGAPHWHLWMVLPAGVSSEEFRTWLSDSWSSSMRVGAAEDESARPFLSDFAPETFAVSVAAGTRVDALSAAAAGTVARLTNYFLKESVASGNKNYQNRPPKLWAGQSVGRFWGVRGIRTLTVEVCLDPRYAPEVWRAMRKWREARGFSVVREVARVNSRTGEVRMRRARRRVVQRSAAGYVMVPNGAEFLSELGRLVTILENRRLVPDPPPKPRLRSRDSRTFPGVNSA